MPGFIVTTSRYPTPRIRSLVKDLVGVLPGALRLTRGHYSMRELALEAQLAGASKVIVIGGRRGNPSIIRVYEVHGEGLENIVTFIVRGVTLSREARRPLPPENPTGMVVETDGSPITGEFAAAFEAAFGARIEGRPGPREIAARIEGEGPGSVLVEFTYAGKPVGPRLRLSKPVSMVKRSMETGRDGGG